MPVENNRWEAATAEGGAMAEDLYVLEANLSNTLSKIMDLESRVESQEQEVLRLEMALRESESFHDVRSELERAAGLEVLSISDEFLEIRVISSVPAMQSLGPNHKDKYAHELAIKIDTTTMSIEAVQLMPEDIHYEDLVAEVKSTSVLRGAPSLVKGRLGWGKQVNILISKIRHRVYANIFRDSIVSVSAEDPRYNLKYLPEANLVIATLPGPVTANVAIPYEWPLPGFSFHLNSLVPSSKGRGAESTDILLQCVDLANSSPESQGPDILHFLQTIEKIYISKRKVSSNQY